MVPGVATPGQAGAPATGNRVLLELQKYRSVIRKNICVISADQFAVLSRSSCPPAPGAPRRGTMTAVQEPAAGSADVDELRAEVEALRARLAQVEASAQGVEAALAYLDTASVALAESLDIGATLTTLGNLIVPRLADWCAIHLADFDGSTRLASVQHLDPARAELVRDLLEADAVGADGPASVGAVLRSGVTAFRPQMTEDQLAAAAHDEVHLEALRSLHLGSAVIVALIARGHRLGALTLLTEGGHSLGQAEVALP